MKNLFLYSALAATALLGLLSGCVQKEDPYVEPAINPDDPALRTYEYSLLIPAANEAQTVVLKDFTKPVYKVDNPASWLTVEVLEEMQDGFPVMEVTSSQDNKDQEVTVTIKSEAREEIRLVAYFSLDGDAASGANADFYTDWEHCETVMINGKSAPVNLPWITNSENNIPYEVTKQYRKAEGWEMAFCSLSNTATDDICYFALYNKWSGTLRVFHYVLNPLGYGQEIDYKVWMGRQKTANNAAFYNSLEFGVPASHTLAAGNLAPDATFIGSKTNQSQSFMTWVTPYLRETQKLVPGWYCFDLDMTGYVPKGTQWRDYRDDLKMSIVPVSREVQDITLRGSLVGDIGGTFDNPETIQYGGGNCLSGVSGVLGMIGNTMSGKLGSTAQYASTLQGSKPFQVAGHSLFWGGMACSLATSLIDFIGGAISEEPTYEYCPGKIDLKMDAQLDLSGTISNYVSSKDPIFNVTLDNINATNGANGHFGRGIWSLAEDPVVYLDSDDLMADYDHFTIYNKFDGQTQYYSSDFNAYGVRFVYFLDPTSVKVNINPDLFPNIEKVYVSTTCGVYPSRQSGYADSYRSFLRLPSHKIDLAPGEYKQVVRLSNSSTPRILRVKPQDLLLNGPDEYETPANSTQMQQKGSEYRYYGRKVYAGDKDIIVDPQIYMCITTPNGHITDPHLPGDLIVAVEICFEAEGNTYIFTKCFVPRIEVIDRSQTLAKYTELQKYADDCAAGKATGTLANISVPVHHPDGDVLLAKTLRMLKRVKDGK